MLVETGGLGVAGDGLDGCVCDSDGERWMDGIWYTVYVNMCMSWPPPPPPFFFPSTVFGGGGEKLSTLYFPKPLHML